MKKSVLIILPAFGFDPSEAAIPWRRLTEAGERVVFTTPEGRVSAADPHMVTGEGLDWWGWIPGVSRPGDLHLFSDRLIQALNTYRGA